MSITASPTVFVYTSDPDKTFEQNLGEMNAHIAQMTQEGKQEFKLTLQLENGGGIETLQLHQDIEDMKKEVSELVHHEMVPHSVDKDGEALYKRQKVS